MMKAANLCLVLLVSGHGLVHAEKGDLALEEASVQPGKGVIIEFEEASGGQREEARPAPLDKSANKKKKSGRQRQVELIVGGQGEDGVSKRGQLIIND